MMRIGEDAGSESRRFTGENMLCCPSYYNNKDKFFT